MVVNHVIPEIYHENPEIHISAFMYDFRNYMAYGHVNLESCFMEILQVCNFGMTWLSTM